MFTGEICGQRVEIYEQFQFPKRNLPSELARIGKSIVLLRETEEGLMIDCEFYGIVVVGRTRQAVLGTLDRMFQRIQLNTRDVAIPASARN